MYDYKPGQIIPGPLRFVENGMPIGDLDSDEKGTGARMNENKPHVELLPVRHWAHLFWTAQHNAKDMEPARTAFCIAVDALATFQEGNFSARALLAPLWPTWYDEAVDVFVYGTGKYRKWNWLKGQPWSVPLASALRHARADLIDGELRDKESGLSHVGHFTCNVIMLAQFSKSYKAGNDFPATEYFHD